MTEFQHHAPQAWMPWVELLEISGLGPRYWHRLLSVLGSPEIILNAELAQLKCIIPERVAKAIIERVPAQAAITRTQEWLEAGAGRRFVLTWADKAYPSALLSLADPPPVVFYHGCLELLERPMLAVVGGRNATVQGCRDAEAWAEALSSEGLTIVSGLAQGIDAAAHRGALRAKGSTIAVVGTGADRVYPSEHRELAHQVAEQGGLLSEFSLGTPAIPSHFPRRNRIISGLSRGCLVVEAALKSGSLITARLAAEQGRDVFAIPGSIHSPLSKGCHQLIKEGAKLVESAEDILEEFRGLQVQVQVQAAGGRRTPQSRRAREEEIAPLLSSYEGSIPPMVTEDLLWSALGYEAVDMDTLCVRTGWAVEHLSARLLEFELEGYIVALPGGRYQRLG